jgi:diacylglycerol kinase family enzyme
MRGKHAYLVINPRAGQDMTKLADVIAVLSAAGWKTDNALVEYSGHSITLATKAAEEGYDLIIAHGGDGTINEVVNGVMKSKGHQSVIAVLPGGTANQWATEIGMPLDPVKAALTLIESRTRKVDLGRMKVQGLSFPTPVLATWHICSKICLLGTPSSTNNTPYCFLRDTIILSNFSQRFLLFKNTVQHSRLF